MADDDRQALRALLMDFDRSKLAGDGGLDVFRAIRTAVAHAEVARRYPASRYEQS
ncbi:hypothetical protein ACFOMD_14855 [Sphingoaurantiacus capsulatus]|uniref:Uncharacterized protein n=1 Tax=Sphingoaurantiacus capsulatus TaxID=1771310 RepID=A0ABV7XCN1_9SPHN